MISRRKFLQTIGTGVAGLSLATLSGVLLHKMYSPKADDTCARKDITQSGKLKCANCKLDCPLRKGITL
ncbi:MAG: twin-arginine translocation signal domain-containing protein [Mangrovibacterium sp.]